MSLPNLLLLVHTAATLFMVGAIWVIQLMHYPLYPRVGAEAFRDYQTTHRRLANWTMTPPMFIESSTAVLLLRYRPDGVSSLQVWLGIALLAIILASTFLIQIPRHRRLESGFDPRVHRELLSSNWIRTVAWSARGMLVIWMTAEIVRAGSQN